MTKNHILESFINKAKKTSVGTAGIYVKTAATNVYLNDGTTYELKDVENVPVEDPLAPLPTEPVEEPTETVVPEDVATTISTVEDNAVIEIPEGEVTEAITVEKSVTIQGENAGIAQNFDQEV